MPGGVPNCGVGSSFNHIDGIIAETSGNNVQIINNIIYWTSGGWGMLVGPGNTTQAVTGVQVSNNLVFSTARGGIVFTDSGVYVTNNIMVYNGIQSGANACGYQNASGGTINYANSDLYSNAGGNYCVGYGTDGTTILTGDIAVDPAAGSTFVNWQGNGSGNYFETASSATIGAGSSSGTPPSHDYLNSPRPSGAGYDMGPYQIVSGAALSSVSVAGAGNATSVPIGSTLQMIATCTYADGTADSCGSADAHGNQCSLWTSSNSSYGTISTGGLITGVAAGLTDVGCSVASASVGLSNIDSTLTGWDTCIIGSCPGGGTPGGTGTPTTTQTLTTDGSIDSDTAMEFTMTSTAGDTNALWTYTGAACDSCTNVSDEYYFYLTSATGVGNIEHDEAIFDTTHGVSAMWGRQWNQTVGAWQIFNNQTSTWVTTACTAAPVYGSWNHILFTGHRVINATSCAGTECIYSDTLTVNGTACSMNTAEPAGTLPSGYTHATISQDQLDANAAATLTEYLDESDVDPAVIFSTGIASPPVAINVISATQVATPTFSPPGGNIGTTGTTVTVTDATPSSTIYCTTNGTTPTTASPVYSSSIRVTTTTTIQCLATAAGLTNSLIGAATYTLGSGGGGGGGGGVPIPPATQNQRGNIAFDQVKGEDRFGNNSRFQMACSSGYVVGDLPMYDANGNLCDSGSKSGAGGGGFFAQGYSNASGGQTQVTLQSQPLPQSVSLYSNGAIVSPGAYTLSGTIITLTSALNPGPVVATWATNVQTAGGIGLGSTYANVRGTGHGAGTTGASITVPFPSGTLSGDLVLVFAAADYNLTLPSGWTSGYSHSGAVWNPMVIYKTMTGADIASGSVTISAAGSQDWAYQIVDFLGPTGGIREVDGSYVGATTTQSITTSASVLSTDAAMYFGSGRSNTSSLLSCAVSRGTLNNFTRNTAPGGADSAGSCLYTEQLISAGAISPAFSYTTSTNTAQAVVIVENP